MERQGERDGTDERDDADLDERPDPARAPVPIGDLPPRDPCDHRRDVHREERGGRSQLGVPRRPHRGDDVGEERREHHDVAGGDTEQAAHPEPGEDRPERSGDPLGRRPRLTGHDEREPEPGHRDRGRRDEERELRATERVQGGIRERGNRASERHRHLPHAERPATSRRRVGREERSCACDGHDGRADAGEGDRGEEGGGRRRERSNHEPDRAERRSRQDRESRTDPVDEDSGPDECEPGSEHPRSEHGAEREEAHVVVDPELRADRGKPEEDERDGGLCGGRTREHDPRCLRRRHPPDYPWRVDRDAIARAGRRAQAEEALAFEREREAALREQIAALVLEDEAPRLDAEAFASLDDADVQLVRTALGELADELEAETDEEDPFAQELYVTFDDDVDEPEEDEVARLEGEIEESLRVQHALQRFIAALEQPVVPEVH